MRDWKRNRGKVNQVILAVIVNLGGMCFGIAESWTSPALQYLKSENSHIPKITSDDVTWIGSLVFMGSLVASPIFGYLVDKIGRKRTGYVVGVTFLTSWIVKYFARSSAVLLVGRFVMGLGSGGSVVLAPAYIGDIAQADIRGALASLYELFINVGIVFVYVVGAYISYDQLTIVCATIPIIYLIGIFCLPESPIFLLRLEKPDEAQKSLMWLRYNDTSLLEEEMSSMKRLVNARRSSVSENVPTVKDVILSRATRRGLMTSLTLSVIQHFCGIVAILSYTSMIFEESGSNLSPNVSAIFVGIVQLIGSFVATGVIDRFGRRFLTITSNLGLAITLVILFAYFLLKSQGTDLSSFQYLPVVSICVYIFFYAIGMGPIPFVILSEMFSPKIQGLVSSIVLLFMWTLAFTVAKTFSIIGENLGVYSVYGIYSLFSIFGIIYGSFFLLETKNKSLETILKELGGEDTITRDESLMEINVCDK